MHKIIEEFPNYIIYDDGRVYSMNSKKFLAINFDKGYPQVNLYRNGKRCSRKIHRLVAKAFVPNPNNLPQVNHIDENKTNNHYTNLEWCTPKYNVNYGTRNERIASANLAANLGAKRVGAYKNGELVQEFVSISEGARFVDGYKANISKCLHGKAKTAYGYVWKFVD